MHIYACRCQGPLGRGAVGFTPPRETYTEYMHRCIIYIYIYIYMCIYIYIYTCIHVYICIYIYIYTHRFAPPREAAGSPGKLRETESNQNVPLLKTTITTSALPRQDAMGKRLHARNGHLGSHRAKDESISISIVIISGSIIIIISVISNLICIIIGSCMIIIIIIIISSSSSSSSRRSRTLGAAPWG